MSTEKRNLLFHKFLRTFESVFRSALSENSPLKRIVDESVKVQKES